MSTSATNVPLLPRLLGLLLLCSSVQAHGDVSVDINELTTTTKGWLVLVTAFVGFLVILFLSILTICCWYNCCSKYYREREQLSCITCRDLLG